MVSLREKITLKNLVLITFLLLTGNNAFGQDELITKIFVKEALLKGQSGINRTSEPVSIGVPLKEDSGITSTDQLLIKNFTEQQFRVLDRWPNGNIKWVLVDFQVDLNAGDLLEDIELFKVDGTGGNTQAPNLSEDLGNHIEIETGPAIFKIRKNNFNFFDHVEINGETIVQEGNNGGLYLVDDQYLSYSSINDPSSEAIIEENGPLRTVVKSEGVLTNLSSNTHLWYTVRFHFYKGKPYSRAVITFRNASINSIASKTFRSIEARIPLTIGQNKTVTLPSNIGVFTDQLTERAYLFQSFSVDHEFEGPRDDIYRFSDCQSKMFNFEKPGLLVVIDDQNKTELGNQDQWGESWAQVVDDLGRGMTFGMKWMSAYWPAGFDLYANGDVNIELFSKNADYLIPEGQSEPAPLIFGFNRHETRETLLYFHTNDLDGRSNVKLRMEAPVIAFLPLDTYRGSNCIFSQEKIPSIDEENLWRQNNGKANITVCDENRGVNIWRQYWWSGTKAIDFSYKDFIQFYRTGCSNLFLNAETIAQFAADYAVKRTDDSSFSELYSKDRYYWAKSSGTFQQEPFDQLHNHWLSMPLYYFHTGDERIKEALLDYKEEYIQKGVINFNVIGDMRGFGRHIRTLAYLFEFTHDEAIGDLLKKSMDNLLDSRAVENSYTPGGRSLTRGYLWQAHNSKFEPERVIADFYTTKIFADNCWSAYWTLKHSESLNYQRLNDVESFLSGLAQFITKEFLFDDSRGLGYLYDYWLDEPNYIGDPNHPDNGSWENIYSARESSRILAYEYERTGNKFYLNIGERLLLSPAADVPDHDMQRFQLIYDSLYPPLTKTEFMDVNVTNNGGDSYTLSWNVPKGARGYRIKFSNKPIVEWLGFNQRQRTYEYPPEQYTAFFAAVNFDDPPPPDISSGVQELTIDVSEAINKYNQLRGLQAGEPAYVPFSTGSTYHFKVECTIKAPSAPTGLTIIQ